MSFLNHGMKSKMDVYCLLLFRAFVLNQPMRVHVQSVYQIVYVPTLPCMSCEETLKPFKFKKPKIIIKASPLRTVFTVIYPSREILDKLRSVSGPLRFN